MKKLLVLLAALALVAAACGNGEASDDGDTGDTGDDGATTTTTQAPTPSPEPEDEGLMMGMSADELRAEGYVVVEPGQNIRIGNSVALTGPIPEPGRDIANGAEIAADDINAAGGILGFQVELVVEDGACDGDAGTIVGNSFAADPSIVAVSGGTCTGETLGLQPILQEARIPFVSPSATNPAIITPECDVCNRVALNDALQGYTDAEYAYNVLGVRSVAVMDDSSDYGAGLADLFTERFVELGGTVTSRNGIQVGDTDFRPVLTTITTEAPELIFFGGYETEAGLLASQRVEVGLGDAIFFSDDGAYTTTYLDVSGAAGEGTYASFVSGDDVAEANAEFDQKYLDKFGQSPDDVGPFHAQSYDSVILIADAIERAAVVEQDHLIILREDLISAIRATSSLQGLTGVLTCDENGECGAGGVQIYQVVDGEFTQVAGFGLDE